MIVIKRCKTHRRMSCYDVCVIVTAAAPPPPPPSPPPPPPTLPSPSPLHHISTFNFHSFFTTRLLPRPPGRDSQVVFTSPLVASRPPQTGLLGVTRVLLTIAARSR
ncbi:hypothetical protein PV325_007478 [Microctonus aethiopoides]|nr:hypothetical protein PV325_007478 [Microctonus aethiopoides]